MLLAGGIIPKLAGYEDCIIEGAPGIVSLSPEERKKLVQAVGEIQRLFHLKVIV